MTERLVYASRLIGLPLVSPEGAEIGRLADVALGTSVRGEPPRVNGFVVAVQRRRVLVSAGRIGDLGSEGARLRYGSITVHQFEPRPGELLVAGELFGRRERGKRVVDLGIRPVPRASYAWEAATVALGGAGLLGRRAPEGVTWSELAELFAAGQPAERQAAAISLLHPAEMAEAIRNLPLERRRVLAGALGDERLADLLEELPQSDQVRIVEGLDLEHAARVLDEMDADAAADLLGELPSGRRVALLGAMAPDEAAPVRRLLRYAGDTAGGLMNPEPVMMPPTASIPIPSSC